MADNARRLEGDLATIDSLRSQLNDLRTTVLNRLATHTHSGGGGVTDHGALTGLGDDDHTQYQLRSEKDGASGYLGLDGAGNVPTAKQYGASTSGYGIIRLQGDLAGSAGTPTVPGLALKAPLVHTHSASDITGVGEVLLGRCTADTTRTSSTTLLDVTGMTVSLDPNATYALEAALIYTGNPTGDIKFAWSGPAGVGGSWAALGPRVNQNPTTSGERFNYTDFGVLGITTTLNLAADSAFPILAFPKGFVTTGGTGGTFKLQFAQDVSNATATVVKAGSWMRLTRLA